MEFIELLSESALKDLQTANLELTKMVANVDKVGQKMQSITTPSGSDGAIKDLAKRYADQEKQLQKVQKELERTRLAEIKLAQDREKAFDKFSKQNERELKEVQKVSGLYNKSQIAVKQLSEMYNDLAIKKAYGHKLTVQEEAQLVKLTREINIYQSALKKVDADIQKNQRNVGNYASGWNGLGNSINQLTREMPAFANSAQTGFMALSNNIPILFDEIEKIKNSNKDLIAQGQPIKSVFSQIAGAVLSWGTALSVGVTLLTIFGPKIWDSVMGTKAKKEALEKEKEALAEKAKVEKQAYEQQVKYASDEQAKSKLLLETAKNVKLSMEDRIKAVKELQQRYPDYLGKLSQEKILAGETAEMEYKLNDALMKRALFLATQDKIIEKTKELVDVQMQYAKTNQAVNSGEDLYDMNANKNLKTKQKLRLATDADLQSTKALEQAVNSANKTNVTSTSVFNEKTLAIRKQLDILYAMLNANSSFVNVVNEETNAIKKNREAKREDIEAIKLQEDSLKGLIEKLTALKSALEKQRAEESRSKEDYDNFTKSIDAVGRSIDGLTTGYKDLTQTGVDEFLNVYGNRASKASKDTEELEKALKSLFQTTANGALTSFGMDSLIPMFDGTFNKMWETANTFNEKFAVGMKYIGDVAKQTFEFINKQQQAQYDQQFARLEQERDIALLFAGESATAREEIERQYEERRRSIQRKQAESQKKIAIFNSIVNTAQGVTSALAMANIPLAIVIGALGAIQTAMIASQQIPQFYKGTDNAPEGWAYTQEKGAEIITDKNGKIKTLGSNKGAELTYLNKGDKVYTAEQSSVMFDNGLNDILTSNGISMPKVNINVDNGLTNAKLDKIAKAIENKDTLLVSRDARGEQLFKIKNGTRQQMLNTRLKIGKFDV